MREAITIIYDIVFQLPPAASAETLCLETRSNRKLGGETAMLRTEQLTVFDKVAAVP